MNENDDVSFLLFQASASVKLLTHEKPKDFAEEDQHLWNDKPVTFAIYKLCSQPLTTEVCGFFTLSRSTFLNVLHVSATYLVIFMQFRLLEDPRSFSKKESGAYLSHSITPNLELHGNETDS
ncbi:uncharacterized protein [Palaemon carinicauda]|uniref:uncharacterized protein n=1 Tax=Palaemon carinicauda TaxID=392227 RepID=UPI0035B60F2C